MAPMAELLTFTIADNGITWLNVTYISKSLTLDFGVLVFGFWIKSRDLLQAVACQQLCLRLLAVGLQSDS